MSTGLPEVFLYFTTPWVFTNLSKIVSTLSPQKNLATPVPQSDSQKGASTRISDSSPGCPWGK